MEHGIGGQVAISWLRAPWSVLVSWRRFALFLGVLLATALLVQFNPAGSRWFPPCPFTFLTGLYCPGCGSTRALHHLLHGRIAAAFGYNAMMVSSLPFLLVNGAARMLPACERRLFDEKALSPAVIVGILVCVVSFGVLRNLPMYPFSFLAPHG